MTNILPSFSTESGRGRLQASHTQRASKVLLRSPSKYSEHRDSNESMRYVQLQDR